MTWFGFAGVFGLFFLTHSVPVRPAVKSRITARIGQRGFGIGYSILSLAMLSLLIWSAGEAPYVQLWPQMIWQRHVVHIGMLAACLILAFSIGRPNPFSFGGANNQAFNPTRPGIVRWTRHPILLVLALWAGLHLLPNGDLAHVLLFAVLGSFAIAGRALINRRKQREMGAERWNAVNRAVQEAPLVQKPLSMPGTALRLAAGVLTFVILLALHPVVIGVSAL
ncbi:NnrU family protein [Loktanella sp. 5RATIMAR09]|uniref:NnrU family protein n=1 Tax=Loktanella sp. 5RATIMAR09 TaxID=1225655 RepID=UPI0006EBCE12|nr:NnrU family protein [Loktanella sp. 5RATIMAR09]KQI73697.1 NnrU family protein [Loktanella sp. 5RATIMAR09]